MNDFIINKAIKVLAHMKPNFKKFEAVKCGGKFVWMDMKMLRIENKSLLGTHGNLPGNSAFSTFNSVNLDTGILYHVQNLEIVVHHE